MTKCIRGVSGQVWWHWLTVRCFVEVDFCVGGSLPWNVCFDLVKSVCLIFVVHFMDVFFDCGGNFLPPLIIQGHCKLPVCVSYFLYLLSIYRVIFVCVFHLLLLSLYTMMFV